MNNDTNNTPTPTVHVLVRIACYHGSVRQPVWDDFRLFDTAEAAHAWVAQAPLTCVDGRDLRYTVVSGVKVTA